MEVFVQLLYYNSFTLYFLYQVLGDGDGNSGKYPIVVSTWPFTEAVRAAWRIVDSGFSAVDAVTEGCSACEELRCDGTGGITILELDVILSVLCSFYGCYFMD